MSHHTIPMERVIRSLIISSSRLHLQLFNHTI